MNPLISRHCRQILVVLCLVVFGPRLAQAIYVQEVGIHPTEIVNISTMIYPAGTPWTGNVYAGVNQLLVDGNPMNGFCIDPFHFSANSAGYSFVPLINAPKYPGPMTAWEATRIERLWGSYYSLALTDASGVTAAGLQIAIWEVVWEVVGGPSLAFQLNGSNDYGASVFLAHVSDPLYSGPVADLVALTGPGQDYVVERVPDSGTTLTLFGLTIMGFAIFGMLRSKTSTLLSDRSSNIKL